MSPPFPWLGGPQRAKFESTTKRKRTRKIKKVILHFLHVLNYFIFVTAFLILLLFSISDSGIDDALDFLTKVIFITWNSKPNHHCIPCIPIYFDCFKFYILQKTSVWVCTSLSGRFLNIKHVFSVEILHFHPKKWQIILMIWYPKS